MQSARRSLQKEDGFRPPSLTLHPPGVSPNCANQPARMKSDRRTMGRRAGESDMPDHYDRAICVTELMMLGRIVDEIETGRRPAHSCEVPNAQRVSPARPDASADQTRPSRTTSRLRPRLRMALSFPRQPRPKFRVLNWKCQVRQSDVLALRGFFVWRRFTNPDSRNSLEFCGRIREVGEFPLWLNFIFIRRRKSSLARRRQGRKSTRRNGR